MEIKITRIDKDLPLPEYKTSGAVAFDLYARQRVEVPPREIRLIPLNVIIAVPNGYFLLIASRSSTPQKKGLMCANSLGIMDKDFCGPADEIQYIGYNFTNETITINRGDRIAQGVLVRYETAQIDEVATPLGPNRGGIGSTG
jgi:dUTP pyrophosphatase